MIKHLIAVLLIASGSAYAQVAPECIPFLGTGIDFHVGMSKNGKWMWWYCPRPDGYSYRTRYIGDWSISLNAISYRMEAIRIAADPLAKAQELHKKYATLSVTDPKLAAVWADYLADLKVTP